MYRSQELEYKYGNLSEGVCKPGYAAAKMATIYPKWDISFGLFFACEELTFNAKSRSLRIDNVNWMSAREKLLLKHANLHDVTPQTN